MAEPGVLTRKAVLLLKRLKRLLAVKVAQGLFSKEESDNYYLLARQIASKKPVFGDPGVTKEEAKAGIPIIDEDTFPFYDDLFDNQGNLLPDTTWESKIRPLEIKIAQEKTQTEEERKALAWESQVQEMKDPYPHVRDM